MNVRSNDVYNSVAADRQHLAFGHQKPAQTVISLPTEYLVHLDICGTRLLGGGVCIFGVVLL